MASFRARIVRQATGFYFRARHPETADIGRLRRRWEALARRLPLAGGVRATAITLAGRPAIRLTPERAAADRVLLYLHGGAYVLGSPTTHRQLVSHIAQAGGVAAVLPDYRLAPEHPFPAALEDAVAAYARLLESGMPPGQIAVGGDSAGGGLAVALLIELRERRMPLPAVAILLSPWLDLTGSGETMVTRADADPWFRPGDMPLIAGHYCRPDERRDPRVSPVFAELSGLPPLCLQVGDDEILLDDSRRLAAGIEAAGGTVHLEVWPEMWHVFQIFVPYVPEARRAVGILGQRLAGALGTDASVG